MKTVMLPRAGLNALLAFLIVVALPISAAEQIPPDNAATLPGVAGGLVVQLGGAKTDLAASLSRTGRYIINVLERDDDRVNRARIQLSATGSYGLASADRIADPKRLPYSENLVNAILVEDFSVAPAELLRALTPRGVLIVANPKLLTSQALATAGFDEIAEAKLEEERELLPEQFVFDLHGLQRALQGGHQLAQRAGFAGKRGVHRELQKETRAPRKCSNAAKTFSRAAINSRAHTVSFPVKWTD